MQVEVFTNGTLIDAEKAERMAALKVMPYVKLYSTRSWVHDQMVGRQGAWKKALDGIDNLVAAGYGAAILPLEGPLEPHLVRGIQAVPLKPALTRDTVIVHRALPLLDGATRSLLEILKQFRQR